MSLIDNNKLDPEVLLKDYLNGEATQDDVAKLFNFVVNNILVKFHTSVFWGDRMLALDRAASFQDDPVFFDCMDRIKNSHKYDQYDGKNNISWRIHTLIWAANHALKVDGDFVECGVFKGDMSWVLLTVLGEALKDRKFFLYDSFEGISPKQSSESDYPDLPGFMSFANKIYSDPEVYNIAKEKFKHFNNAYLIKGVVPEIFSDIIPKKIAYLHIDLNSAKAEIAALEALFPKLSDGGVIVFDDFGWNVFKTQRIAEQKWAKENNLDILELPTGQAVIVKSASSFSIKKLFKKLLGI